MHDSEAELSALSSLAKPESIEIHTNNQHKVSLFDQLIGQGNMAEQPESAIQLLDASEPVMIKQECKIEEESQIIHHITEQSRTQEEPVRRTTNVISSHCSCERSHCTKNYCPCFKEQNGCGSSCKCRNCGNKSIFQNKTSKPFAIFPFWSTGDLKWN